MKKLSLYILTIISLLAFFSIKSSTINFDKKYQDLNIKANKSMIFGDLVIGFSDNFSLTVSAKDYEEKTFLFSHSNKVSTINLKKQNIGLELRFNPKVKKEKLKIYINEKQVLINEKIFLVPGEYSLKILSEEFLKFEKKFNISPQDTLKEFLVELKKKDENKVKFEIKTTPVAAQVFIDGEFFGDSPVSINLNKISQRIEIAKIGYESVLIPLERIKDLSLIDVNLNPELGEVEFLSQPKAEVLINKKSIGETPITLKLQTIKQDYELIKENYRSIKGSITPNSDRKLKVSRSLLTEKEALIKEARKSLTNSIGISFELISPSNVVVGSYTDEIRRKRNETIKNIKLSRHFLVSKFLITEFQFFLSKATESGSKELPVRNVSWKEAALFCNWLSTKEGYKPFYLFKENGSYELNTNSTGYRLLTEAEWEYVARGLARKVYPWGNEQEISEAVGNFADESLSGEVNFYIQNYYDDYKDRSPIDAFAPNEKGLHDLGGNLSEWVTDFYSEDLIFSNEALNDYLGPEFGNSHVVKGSNYLSSSYHELGFSFRDSGEVASDVVGFRIARWVY